MRYTQWKIMVANTQQSILVNLMVDVREATRSINDFRSQVTSAFSGFGRGGSQAAGGLAPMITGLAGAAAGVYALTSAYQQLSAGINEAASLQTRMFGAAGSLSSVTKQNYGDALRLTKELNAELSNVAASLPGVTNDYVQAANSLAAPVAQAIREETGTLDERYFRDQLIELTKNMTLTSLGLGGSSGDAAMFSQRFINTGQMGELRQLLVGERGSILTVVEEILKERGMTAKDLSKLSKSERLKILTEASERANPEEMIQNMSDSVEGMLEGFRSSLFDPNTGLFGMLRPIEEFNGNSFLDSVQDLLHSFSKMGTVIQAVLGIDLDPMLGLARVVTFFSEMSYMISNGLRLGEGFGSTVLFAGKFFTDSVGGLIEGAMNAVAGVMLDMSTYTSFGSGLANGLAFLGNMFVDLFNAIDWFQLGDIIGSGLIGLVNAIVSFLLTPSIWIVLIKALVSAMVALAQFIVGLIKGLVVSVVMSIVEATAAILEAIPEAFAKALDSFKSFFKPLLDGITSFFSGVGAIFEGITSSLQSVLDWFINMGRRLGLIKDSPTEAAPAIPNDAITQYLTGGAGDPNNLLGLDTEEPISTLPPLSDLITSDKSPNFFADIKIDGTADPQETAERTVQEFSNWYDQFSQQEFLP